MRVVEQKIKRIMPDKKDYSKLTIEELRIEEKKIKGKEMIPIQVLKVPKGKLEPFIKGTVSKDEPVTNKYMLPINTNKKNKSRKIRFIL